jgi:two-component system OmpR family sensor kinase
MTPVDMDTVLKNLVGNAIQYTPAGGRIDLAVTEIERYVVVTVDDSGPGIPDSEKAAVFEPFHRSLGTDVAGSGLGLSIVKSVVQRYGGYVELGDAPQGTSGLRVSVSIPISNSRGSCSHFQASAAE